MTLEIWIVFGILAATIVLFVSDRLRLDITALLALLALTLTGILTPSEAAAGFGDTTVLLIAALFVVSDALLQTGIAEAMGRWLGRVAGTSERRILVTMMLVVAPISAFVSSTGAVAIMLPVVVAVANRAGISPSRLLLPLAYTALIGGMLTLIGTPPNIIASEARAGAGRGAFGFFSFTPIGALVLGAAIIFLTTIGQRLLPDRIAGPNTGEHGSTLIRGTCCRLPCAGRPDASPRAPGFTLDRPDHRRKRSRRHIPDDRPGGAYLAPWSGNAGADSPGNRRHPV